MKWPSLKKRAGVQGLPASVQTRVWWRPAATQVTRRPPSASTRAGTWTLTPDGEATPHWWCRLQPQV